MAERTATVQVDSAGHLVAHWTGLLNGDTGRPVSLRAFGDASVQLAGTLGTGGNVNLEGSNNGGASWAQLNDPQGNPISLSDLTTIETILEYVEQIRPNVTAGDGATDLECYVIARKPV